MLHLTLLSLAFFAVCSATTTIPPATVDSIDINSYVGKWYQVYGSLLPEKTYEKNGYCITAEYTLIPPTGSVVSFSIVNSEKYTFFYLLEYRILLINTFLVTLSAKYWGSDWKLEKGYWLRNKYITRYDSAPWPVLRAPRWRSFSGKLLGSCIRTEGSNNRIVQLVCRECSIRNAALYSRKRRGGIQSNR